MKHYEHRLKDDLGLAVKYVDFDLATESLYKKLNNKYKERLAYFDPIDKSVQGLLKRLLPFAAVLETRNYWLSGPEMSLFNRDRRYNFKSVFEH